MSKKFKVVESNIQPNHKEAEIWALPQNNGSKELKYWDESSKEWKGGGQNGIDIINGVIIFNYSHFDSATFTSANSFVIMDLNAKILHSQGEYTTEITDNIDGTTIKRPSSCLIYLCTADPEIRIDFYSENGECTGSMSSPSDILFYVDLTTFVDNKFTICINEKTLLTFTY